MRVILAHTPLSRHFAAEHVFVSALLRAVHSFSALHRIRKDSKSFSLTNKRRSLQQKAIWSCVWTRKNLRTNKHSSSLPICLRLLYLEDIKHSHKRASSTLAGNGGWKVFVSRRQLGWRREKWNQDSVVPTCLHRCFGYPVNSLIRN